MEAQPDPTGCAGCSVGDGDELRAGAGAPVGGELKKLGGDVRRGVGGPEDEGEGGVTIHMLRV